MQGLIINEAVMRMVSILARAMPDSGSLIVTHCIETLYQLRCSSGGLGEALQDYHDVTYESYGVTATLTRGDTPMTSSGGSCLIPPIACANFSPTSGNRSRATPAACPSRTDRLTDTPRSRPRDFQRAAAWYTPRHATTVRRTKSKEQVGS